MQTVLVLTLLALAVAGAAAQTNNNSSSSSSSGGGKTQVLNEPSRQPVILQAMINSEISSITFTVPRFDLVPPGWSYITRATPLYMARNFTLSSSASPPTVVNFVYLANRVVLDPGITYKFENMTLLNAR